MDLVRQGIDLLLHLDKHLDTVATTFGPWLYLLMFVVIFCETGLVVTPILPGDSLLFAFGMLAAREGSHLSIALSVPLLIVAAIAGDAVNYWVGYVLGPKVFHYENSWLLNKKHLVHTHEFYERHGGKTIVIARFIPIVRTFAPFVAGIARMGYVRFWQFNCVGGATWICLFLLGGYYFGNIPLIKNHFELVMVAIVLISVMPMGIEWLNARRRARLAVVAPSIAGAEPVAIAAEKTSALESPHS
jgi:membrane-associated protein